MFRIRNFFSLKKVSLIFLSLLNFIFIVRFIISYGNFFGDSIQYTKYYKFRINIRQNNELDAEFKYIFEKSSQIKILGKKNVPNFISLEIANENTDNSEKTYFDAAEVNLLKLELNYSIKFIDFSKLELLKSYNNSFTNNNNGLNSSYLILEFFIIDTSKDVDVIEFFKSQLNQTKKTHVNYFLSYKIEKEFINVSEKRKYLISYFQRPLNDSFIKQFQISIENASLSNPHYLINFNCDSFQLNQRSTLCFTYKERYSYLVQSSFTFIFNSMSEKAFWSYDALIRLIESLKHGTIPVIPFTHILELPFNSFIDWNKVIIKVPVSEIHNLTSILTAIKDEELVLKREAALKIYVQFFSTKKAQVDLIFASLQESIHIPPNNVQMLKLMNHLKKNSRKKSSIQI